MYSMINNIKQYTILYFRKHNIVRSERTAEEIWLKTDLSKFCHIEVGFGFEV